MALKELRELGRGSFGRVYLATDDSHAGPVAVKELLDPSADLDRFGREIRILAEQIRNQYVVDIYSYDLDAPRPYLVMEYCEGGSLRNWTGQSSWKHVAVVLLHAAHGLLGIHLAGGFHRDLKPDNLLLARSPDGDGFNVKVADFGLARKPQTASPMTWTPAGTPGYMAPELFTPGAQFSAQADIYSLGVIGVELLTGNVAPASLEVAKAPTELKNLLKRMTSPWALIRPTTTDLIIELGRICEMQPPAPPPPPPPSPPSRPAVSGGGGLALLLLGIGGVAAAALAAGNKKEWDANVERYRGRDGRFRRG
ncbi:serine/threonine-protein kinase [Sorangium sp. So ce764]|uniref:serine/threonine-protein kinase n=1 Tax=Sorangium sp. So ce764 TaxID=3133320 RepID=UPI003F61D77B